MAMTEHEGLQIYKDASGNSFILYPITKAHLVDGFEEAVMDLAGIEDGLAKFAHAHAAGDISSGELAADRLPVVPISKGGTGVNTAAAALEALGVPAAISEAITASGAARVEVGSYVGAGKYGSSSRVTLNLGFNPKVVLVNSVTSNAIFVSDCSSAKPVIGGYQNPKNQTVTWATATQRVMWYNSSSAIEQLNNSGETYYYVAIG